VSPGSAIARQGDPGEGLRSVNRYPSPQPSPTRGEGAHRCRYNVKTHLHIPATRRAPGRCEIHVPQMRGRRECRARQCTRSLVCKNRKHTSVVTAGTPEAIRHSLHDGVTAYFVLSPVTGLFVTVVVAMRSSGGAPVRNARTGSPGCCEKPTPTDGLRFAAAQNPMPDACVEAAADEAPSHVRKAR
jgi:hypothetical protein